MKILWMVFAAFLLLSCSDGKVKEKKDDPKGETGLGPVDISKMELEPGLRTKYSQVHFVCTIEISAPKKEEPKPPDESEKDKEKEMRATSKGSREFLVWDILRDYATEKQATISFRHNDVDVQLDWSLKLGVADESTIKDYDDKGYYEYTLINAVYLEGPEAIDVQQYDADGNKTTGSSIFNERQSFHDRVPNTILEETSGSGQKKVSTDGKCILRTIIKEGYEGEFAVIRR